MGCWNGTCGLTRLPILAGDPVVAFIVALKKDYGDLGGGFCYSTDPAEPVGVPVRAFYNDYGGIESIKKTSLAVARKVFPALSVLNEAGEAFSPDELKDIDSLFSEKVERGEAFMDLGGEDLSKLALMLVHEGAYDAALEATASQRTWEKGHPSYRKVYTEQVDHFFEAQKALKEAILKNDTQLILAKLDARTPAMMHLFRFMADSAATQKALVEADSPAIRKVLVDLILMSRLLQETRTPWFWQSGAGSQEGVVPAYEALAKFSLEYIAEDKRKSSED